MTAFKATKANYALLSLPATAMGFALSVQIAALSWILNTQYGLNMEEIGLVWLAGPVAGIFGQVIIGVISDKVWFWGGRRRPFIIIGGTLAALMILALPNLGLIQQSLGIGSLVGIALTVALTLDLAINVSFNPARSVIADVTPEGDLRTKGYTWMQTISGFFGVLAYLIGAYINLYFLIYAGALVVFLFSVIPALLIKEPRHLEGTQADEAMNGTDELLTAEETGVLSVTGNATGSGSDSITKGGTNWIEFLKICAAHAFTWVGVQTMFIYTFGFIKQNLLGFDVSAELNAVQDKQIGQYIGTAFAILNTVGFLLPALVLAPLAERIGRVNTHTVAIFIAAIGYGLVVKFGTSVYAFYAFMVIVGVGWAAVVSLPFAIMSEVVDSRRIGLFMGLFNLSVVLPQIVASLLGSSIELAADKNIIFYIASIMLGVSGLLWLFVQEPDRANNA